MAESFILALNGLVQAHNSGVRKSLASDATRKALEFNQQEEVLRNRICEASPKIQDKVLQAVEKYLCSGEYSWSGMYKTHGDNLAVVMLDLPPLIIEEEINNQGIYGHSSYSTYHYNVNSDKSTHPDLQVFLANIKAAGFQPYLSCGSDPKRHSSETCGPPFRTGTVYALIPLKMINTVDKNTLFKELYATQKKL